MFGTGERTILGTLRTDAAEYSVAISGSCPRSDGASMPKPASFGDVRRTRLSKGMPYQVSSPSRSGSISRSATALALAEVVEGVRDTRCDLDVRGLLLPSRVIDVDRIGDFARVPERSSELRFRCM